jgi:tetratricopeptide (TPR) repeat protein
MKLFFQLFFAFVRSHFAPPPYEPETLFERGLIWAETGKPQKARKAFAALIGDDATPPALLQKARRKHAEISAHFEDYVTAFADIDILLDSDDLTPDVRTELLLLNLSIAESAEDAQRVAESADILLRLADCPPETRVSALLTRANAFLNTEEREKARDDFNAALATTDAPEALRILGHRGLAQVEMAAGEISAAVAELDKLLQSEKALQSERAVALFERAGLLASQQFFRRAISDYSELLALDDVPVNLRTNALYNRGVLLCANDDSRKGDADLGCLFAFTRVAEIIRRALPWVLVAFVIILLNVYFRK